MSAYVQQASLLSGRQAVMAATVGLHVLVIAVLMSITIRPDSILDPPRLIVDVLTQTAKSPPQPPSDIDPDIRRMPVPTLPTTRPVIPLIPLQTRTDAVGTTALPPGDAVPDAGFGTGEAVVPPAPTPLQYEAIRSTDDYYPDTSLRLQEQGTAIVRVCVGPDGRISGTPAVESSSGSRRLDAAAVAWTREGLRFTPATRDGQPVAACKGFRVRFNLR